MFRRLQNNDEIEVAAFCVKILRYLIWPRRKKDVCYFFKLTFIFLCLMVLLFGFYAYIFNLEEFKFVDASSSISGLISGFAFAFEYICHIKTQSKMEMIRQKLMNTQKFGKPNGFDELNKKVDLVTKAFILWCTLCLVGLWTYTMLEKCTENEVSICGFVATSYFPFMNIFVTPKRQLYSTFETFTVFTCIFIGFCCCWLIILMTEYLVNRIEHLKYILKQIPDMDKEKRKEHIKNCILQHYFILEVTKELFDASYPYMFVHFPCANLGISILVYQMTFAFTYQALDILLLWIASIIILCGIGERLSSSSSELPLVIYKSIPFDGDFETQLDLLIMMEGAKKNLSLSAGLMGDCSHIRIVSIMKTTYSFVALMIELD